MEEQGSSDSDDPEYRKAFAALDELDLTSLKPLFKEKHFRDKTLSFIKSEEELKLILKEELTLPFGQRFEFSRLWFEKYHGNEVDKKNVGASSLDKKQQQTGEITSVQVRTTGQTKKKVKSDNDVQVPKEGEKHSSASLKEAVVVDDQDEKQKIDGRTSTQDRPEVVDPTREKPSICSDVKIKEDQEKTSEMSKTQTAEEDPTGRQSVETNELNPTKTLSSSLTGAKDDQIHDKMEGDDDEITGKSTSTDVFSREIRNQEDGATSAVNNKNHTFVTGDNSSIQEKTATVVNEPSEISQKEREMTERPEEEAGETSSQQPTTQSKSKKEKKKKTSKGTGGAEMKEEGGGTSCLEGTAAVAVDNSLTSATAATASVAADFTLPLDNTDDTVTYPQISSNDDKTKDSIDPSVNNNEAKKSTFADVHDRRISSDKNGTSSACIPKGDPFLAADSVIDDQKETRTVVNKTPKKEEDIEEGAKNTSNQQSSAQSKSKKKKKKQSSKGTPGSAETINKSGEEIKVEKEGQVSVADDHPATAPEVAATADEVAPTVSTTDYVKEIASLSDASKKESRKEDEACQGDSVHKVVPLPVTASLKTSTLQNGFSELDGERNAKQECELEGGRLRDRKGDQNKESEGVRRCTPRPRDVAGRDTSYEKGSVFDAEENRELEFKSLVNAPQCSLPWKIMEKAKKFICACLNANSRGIIYFGVGDSQEKGSKYQHGEILGLDVECIKDDINKAFQFVLDDHIKSDAGPLQKGGEQNCVSIHFVPVKIQGNRSNLYVIEIEVSRDWRFCKDNIYYSKSWSEKRGGDKDFSGKKALSDFFKVKDEFDDVAIRTNGASSCVKQLEVDRQVKKPLEAKYKEWRRKTKHGTNETPEELNVEEADAKRFSAILRERLRELNHKEYGYVLVANKLPAHYRGTAHLSFLQNIPWVAVFDLFDSSSRRDGLHHTCNETSDAPRANIRTLDDFKEVTPDKDSFLTTRGTTWILNNEEMQKGDWIKCSKDCLYRALSAYKQCFLPGHLVCVFLCFSESAVNEMADIMESSFSILGNSASSCVTIISETRHVAEAFIKASKPSLQKELAECSITGIPWILLKEIIREMVGPSKFEEKGATTELPYFTGQLKEVLNKIVYSWNDLEVYCPTPRLVTLAETIEKERDAFYKGAQASQINLLQNHSIPRSLEKDLTTNLDRALKSLSKENVDPNYHMKTVTVSYEPGSGATTLCRRILWSKRKDYRCAVVKAITSSTDYQIENLQSIGYDEKNINYSLPVLVLVDNFSESDVRLLTEHIIKRQTKCVLLTTLPISKSVTNSKFEITLGKLDEMETSLVKNILINITSDTERRREAEKVLEMERRFIWFGLELFGREYLKIKERLQNHISSILTAFMGVSREEHQMLLDICCFLNKYSDGCIILPHSVVLDFLYETSSSAKQKWPDIKDVHEVFGGLLLEEQNQTNGYYGWRPAHSLVSEVVTSRISVEETAIRYLERVCKAKAYAMKFLRKQVFRMFLDRKRISDPVFLDGQAIDDGAVATDLENEVFGFYGKRTRYSPVIVDILDKESNMEGALRVLLALCEEATQTEGKAYAWQQLARFMGYEMRANIMDKDNDLHWRLYNAMANSKERPVKLPMPVNGIDAAHTAVDIAVFLQPSFTNHYTTKGGLYLLQLRDLKKQPHYRLLPEAIEICRKALGVYDKGLETSHGRNHFSMNGKIEAIISLLEIVKDLHCFQSDRKFMAFLKKEEVPTELKEVLSEDDQDYVQSLSSSTFDLLNELFGNVKFKQTTTYDENEIRSLNNAKIRASNLRRKFYEITGFDKRELSHEEYSMCLSPSTNQELALYQQKVQDILFIRDETPFSTWSKLSDSEVELIYQLLKSLCLHGRGSHNDMLICSKACLQLKDRPPVDELNEIVTIWVEKCPDSEWAHLFYYMIHFPTPNGSLAPYNSSTKASIKKCGSIVREKAGSGFRKSGAEYFLGKGIGLHAIVSSQEFRWLETKWKSKTHFWRGKEPSERLQRVQGQKDLGSKGIISYQGMQLHFDNALYPSESKDDLWFYVGFTVAGPYAYDPVDNDTYDRLRRSVSLPTLSHVSPERSTPSDKVGNSSGNNGTRGKVRLSKMSSWKPQESASVRERDVDENIRDVGREEVEVFRNRRPHARNQTRAATDGVSDRETGWFTVGGRFAPLLDCARETTQKEPKPDGPALSQRKTDERKRGKAPENRVEEERVINKRDNLKTAVGTRGTRKKLFHLKHEAPDGKLHYGAFVLGAKKSEECFIHCEWDSSSDVRACDRCNFAHGWRGDTLQFVCTKCTEENMRCCREKKDHEPFIWNLGPYRNSRGEVWKVEVSEEEPEPTVVWADDSLMY